jgi:hypothetical protein
MAAVRDGRDAFGLDAELKAKMDGKYDKAKEAELASWIQAVTGMSMAGM